MTPQQRAIEAMERVGLEGEPAFRALVGAISEDRQEEGRLVFGANSDHVFKLICFAKFVSHHFAAWGIGEHAKKMLGEIGEDKEDSELKYLANRDSLAAVIRPELSKADLDKLRAEIAKIPIPPDEE